MTGPTGRGLILYGPPGAGKDTITAAVAQIDPRYELFPRLKVGEGGRVEGYRIVSATRLEALRHAGEIIWSNEQYGSIYAVDRTELAVRLADKRTVIHLGQVEAVLAILNAAPQVRWAKIYLHCPRRVAAVRIAARGSINVEARLRVWDETQPLGQADLSIDTSTIPVDQAARMILMHMERTTATPLP